MWLFWHCIPFFFQVCLILRVRIGGKKTKIGVKCSKAQEHLQENPGRWNNVLLWLSRKILFSSGLRFRIALCVLKMKMMVSIMLLGYK